MNIIHYLCNNVMKPNEIQEKSNQYVGMHINETLISGRVRKHIAHSYVN